MAEDPFVRNRLIDEGIQLRELIESKKAESERAKTGEPVTESRESLLEECEVLKRRLRHAKELRSEETFVALEPADYRHWFLSRQHHPDLRCEKWITPIRGNCETCRRTFEARDVVRVSNEFVLVHDDCSTGLPYSGPRTPLEIENQFKESIEKRGKEISDAEQAAESMTNDEVLAENETLRARTSSDGRGPLQSSPRTNTRISRRLQRATEIFSSLGKRGDS